MRVAFDAGPLLDPPTGVGRYAGALADALELLGVDLVRYAVAWGGRPAEGARGKVVRRRIPARLAQAAWQRFDRPSIKTLFGDVDIVHGTNFVLPSLGGAMGVVTVHDLAFLRDDTFPGGERLRELVPWSIARAARVVVPTQTVANEVGAKYGGEDKIEVTHEGVAPIFFGAAPLSDESLRAMGIKRPFAIAVGTIEPRKNLRRLLDAWSRAAGALKGWTLVLAGPKGWGPELAPTPGVVPIGWVGDATLPGLLAAADVFCYPSTYEGFGLPPLEAMAAGTPALVGSYSAAREVLGDAAMLVDPSDAGALADGLASLAGDAALRANLARAGKARAATYTWERTARATLGAYDAAAGTDPAGDQSNRGSE